MHEQPIEKRRAELERVGDGFSLSPVSADVEQGRDWLQTLQARGLRRRDREAARPAYLPGSRDGVVKVKPHKTADCVVVGLRWKAGGRSTIATLLLGLYRDDGELDYVGSCAVGAKRHDEIAAKVLPLLDETSDRRFSEPNRWGTGELEETPLRPELVVEVRYDKLEKQPLPPRHEADPLPAGQGPRPVHVARGAPAAPAGRPRRRGPPRASGVLRSASRTASWRATAARASARPASSGSSADTAPRRAPPSPRARPTRAARAGRTPPRRCPRADRRARAKRGRHRRDREVLHLDVGQLVPRDGRRHGRVGAAAHRVRGEDRAVARVLVVVDEDALAALLLPPRGRDELGRAPLDLARERERAAAHDGELPVRLDPAVDVDAAVAARLRPAGVADLVEHLVHDRRDALRLGEPGSRLRVDVDAQLVRLLGVGAARRPRAELERREVRRPDDVRELGDAELVGVPARRKRDARGLDPVRAAAPARASARSPRRRRPPAAASAGTAARRARARSRRRPR